MKYLLAVALLAVTGAHLTLFEEAQTDKNLNRLYMDFLLVYSDFQIVFHADFESIDHVQNLMGSLVAEDKFRSILVYNHDTLVDFSRPSVSKVLNLCFSENPSLWSHLAVPRSLHHRDVVIFEEARDGLRERLSARGAMFLKLAGKVIVVRPDGEALLAYHGCFYCGDRSKKFRLLGTMDDGRVTDPRELLPETFQNMNGHLLHTEFIQYYPYIICEQTATVVDRGKNRSVCTKLNGVESHLIETMSKQLNFTYAVHIMDPNASFFDMIKDVNALKVDIAFGGVSMTADRIPLVQFTKQYNTEDFNFLYLFSLSFQEIFDKFVEPFTAIAVWTLYTGAFFLLSLSLYVALKINSDPKYKDVSLARTAWVLLHMVFEQSNANIVFVYRSRLSCAMILSFWWWTSMIMINVYKSTMLSTVVHPPNTEPENLKQLVRAGYTFVGNAQFADIIKDLLQVSDPIYTEALRKTVYGENTCDVFGKILRGRVAMLDEASTIQYEVRSLCDEPDKGKRSLLRIGRKPVRSTGHAWALQVGAPYRQTFDHYFSLVLSGGLFKKWTQDATAKLEGSQIPKSRDKTGSQVVKLSAKSLFPLLVLYSFGMCISALCLCVEILLKMYLKK